MATARSQPQRRRPVEALFPERIEPAFPRSALLTRRIPDRFLRERRGEEGLVRTLDSRRVPPSRRSFRRSFVARGRIPRDRPRRRAARAGRMARSVVMLDSGLETRIVPSPTFTSSEIAVSSVRPDWNKTRPASIWMSPAAASRETALARKRTSSSAMVGAWRVIFPPSPPTASTPVSIAGLGPAAARGRSVARSQAVGPDESPARDADVSAVAFVGAGLDGRAA